MNKSAICKTVLAALLAACLAFNVYLHLSLTKTRSRLESCVPIEKYNQLVQAESNNSVTLNNTLIAQQKHLQGKQAKAQELFSKEDARMAQMEALTNLYEKTGELETKISESAEGRKDFEGQQASAISRMGSKVAALEKAVIKLSLAVQENQFSPPAGAAAKGQTNAAP